MRNNPPFGPDARIWALEHFPVSVGVAATKLFNGSRRVELVSFQADWDNTGIVTIGLVGSIALRNGFRRLVPGQAFGFEPEENATSLVEGDAGSLGKIALQHPVETVDLGTFAGIASAASQYIIVTIGMRQPQRL